MKRQFEIQHIQLDNTGAIVALAGTFNHAKQPVKTFEFYDPMLHWERP